MEVFISWSGEPAGSIAKVLKAWLPRVVPDVKVWLSSENIAKGSQSLHKLTATLDKVTAGIFVVTPENQHSQWLNYEAGSIAVGTSRADKAVWVLRVGLEQKNLTGPLTMFQSTSLDSKEDVGQLVRDINARRTPDAASNPVAYWHEQAWSELQSDLAGIKPIEAAAGQVPPDRPNDELIGEILELARATSRTVGDLASDISRSSAQADLNRVMRRFTGKDRSDVPVNLESVAQADLRRATSTLLSTAGNPLASVASQSGYAGGQGLHGQLALIGKRVRHAQRGLGTVMEVVAEFDGVRAKVQFDAQTDVEMVPLGDLTMVYENPGTATE